MRGRVLVARILALDRGNDSLKAALFDAGKIIARWRVPAARPGPALRKIALEAACAALGAASLSLSETDRRRLLHLLAGTATFHSVVYSSVDPRWTKEIRGILEKMGASRILEVGSKTEFPFEILVARPAKVGPDRLAAAAGVIAAGGREAIIVDAGTAITVDVLSKRGFLGGSIFPGMALMLRSLHEGTAALPLVSGTLGRIDPPGRDTRGAMLSGTHWGVIGAVKELVARSRRRVSRNARIWVTGGGGAALARGLGKGARYEPDLVFLGLHHVFKLNRTQE
jgi:type III pantothenate kinase